jgi:hypothetical protein
MPADSRAHPSKVGSMRASGLRDTLASLFGQLVYGYWARVAQRAFYIVACLKPAVKEIGRMIPLGSLRTKVNAEENERCGPREKLQNMRPGAYAGESNEMPRHLPHDLTKLTLAQIEWCVAYHAAMPLGEIRRRQALTDQQIGLAWRQRNDFALANLRVREEILRRAAERKLPALDAATARRRMKPRRQEVSQTVS